VLSAYTNTFNFFSKHSSFAHTRFRLAHVIFLLSQFNIVSLTLKCANSSNLFPSFPLNGLDKLPVLNSGCP